MSTGDPQGVLGQMWQAGQYTGGVGQNVGGAGQYIGGHPLGQPYPYAQAITPAGIAMQHGDIIVRAVKNGFTAEVYITSGGPNQTYVAENLESLFDAIKLAMVNHVLSEARPEK